MKLPESMRAIEAARPGGSDVLSLVACAVPKPVAGEVLIKVAAAGVNRPDIIQREGKYPPPPGASHILGLEVSGTVVAVGCDSDAHLIGQPVCALIAGGGYAEYAVAPAGQCLHVPEALTMVEAAALPETLFTVWTNVFQRAYADEGETILIHGGTSGIGTMAISLCQLFGISTIVTAGSDAKCDAARALGADHAINYKSEDFVERVKTITEGRGVDIVLDMVGGDYVARNMRCMAKDGRHVSIAVQGGAMANVPIFDIMRKRLTLTGSTLRARSVEFKSLVADEISRNLGAALAGGELRPVIDKKFRLEAVSEAHDRMENGDHIGKIVLVVDPHEPL